MKKISLLAVGILVLSFIAVASSQITATYSVTISNNTIGPLTLSYPGKTDQIFPLSAVGINYSTIPITFSVPTNGESEIVLSGTGEWNTPISINLAFHVTSVQGKPHVTLDTNNCSFQNTLNAHAHYVTQGDTSTTQVGDNILVTLD